MKLNITIPTSLKEITLRQYKKFLKIQKETEDDRFLNAKMIEVFCGIPLDKVLNLKVNDSNEIIETISKLFDEKPNLVTSFKLGKLEYGFHPQLDDLTFGEYIDLDTFIGDWDNMEKAMNVLYRPILVKLKNKYSIEDYRVETAEEILDMPMDAVMSSIFFLWNLGLELSQTMMNCLDNQEMPQEALTAFLNSQQNGDGIKVSFQDSLREILDDLKISQN